MITFKQLLEMWEHPFSGKDYHDDTENEMFTSESGDERFYNEDLRIKAKKLAQNYTPVVTHFNYKNVLSNYVSSSHNLNKLLINSHKDSNYTVGDFHRSLFLNHYHDEHHDFANKAYDLIDKDYNVDLSNHADMINAPYHIPLNAKDNYDSSKFHAYETKNSIPSMDEAMQHVHTPHDMHVYTGTRFHPLKISQMNNKIGGLHLPAFTSTSLRPSVAMRFAKAYAYTVDKSIVKKYNKDMSDDDNMDAHLLKIHVPEGSAGVYVGHARDVSDATNFSKLLTNEESEFIMPRNSKLIVGGKSAKIERYRGRRLHIWHAKLVHDGFKPTRHMDEFK